MGFVYGECVMTTPLRMETARLVLRRFEIDDVPDLIQLLSSADPMIRRVIGVDPTADAIHGYWGAMRLLSAFSDPEWYSLLIELRSDSRVVGTIGYGVQVIDPAHKQGSIGWSLHPEVRGQGLVTEVGLALLEFLFCELGLHRVSARTGADNRASWRVMERLGMRREAYYRESHTLDGEWRDEVVYALLAGEFPSPSSNAFSSA